LKAESSKFPSLKLKSLGICIGASTISLALVETVNHCHNGGNGSRPKIIRHITDAHEGNPHKTLEAIFKNLNPDALDKITVTGRNFRKILNLTSITEPEAVEVAYRYSKSSGIDSPAIVSAGGETIMVYVLNRRGRISSVISDSKCASGTGEFFLQQLRRMNVSLEQASRWASEENPYPISGRCSVFCKSDCTHATNKGIPRSRVIAGLCRMMGNKILDLLKRVDRRNIMIIGGTARNRMIVDYLSRAIPGLIIPEQAPYFEALGAALWGLEHDTIPFPEKTSIFVHRNRPAKTHPPLKKFFPLVEFKTIEQTEIQENDTCILGLDVGSTTTKAVLIRDSNPAILASAYLRTNGDPVTASRSCYNRILGQISKIVNPKEISIIGLGVCGSGRQIAGLHALTDGIINEIIAHAAAAVFFDPKVDTIFEIGGQDAKYTRITRAIPADYAMNGACSAGTGSFLEESAFETLGIRMEDIGTIALKAGKCPNFNDQCAAFIASDIKNAIHEGVPREEIIAGLVYSICQNYLNRVKGNRPAGQKIFMQGGVCYNQAVPLAMAALLDKSIIVPPEPGLMGAFGVALEVKNRIRQGQMIPGRFDLEELKNRGVRYGKSFNCPGGEDHCDRNCEISLIEMEGKKFPFGGACNRYDNVRHHRKTNSGSLDWVRLRQQIIFRKYDTEQQIHPPGNPGPRVGINRSFLVNSYYPLYSAFFCELGIEPVIPDLPDQTGVDRKDTALCFPAELSHGFFYSLINSDDAPEVLFLPHLKSTPGLDEGAGSQVCPFVQGEPYYLRVAFQDELKELEKKGHRILSPLLDLTKGLEAARKPLVAMAVQMGIQKRKAEIAFEKALDHQNKCLNEMKSAGRKVLDELKQDPSKSAVVIFGRSYNGFAPEAHMGIPRKLQSRGIPVIPYDFLPFEDQPVKPNMYWGMGRQILQASELVKKHDQLFALYITNFSCGPDSFILGYFRDILDKKPALILELDSHTADAGLETRIDAFLDIIKNHCHLKKGRTSFNAKPEWVPARMAMLQGKPSIISSTNEKIPLNDRRVSLLFPSMGEVGTPLLAEVFRRTGIRTIAHPPAGETELKLGRENTSGKECLPLILTTGTLLRYIQQQKKDNEILVYFMATGSGPCRFGQYSVFLEDLIRRKCWTDVVLLSLTSENSYLDIGIDIQKRAWWAIVISDILEDVRSLILANSRDPAEAMVVFRREWEMIRMELGTGNFSSLTSQLSSTARAFSSISWKLPPNRVPSILLTGEIFVRRDPLSRQFITEYLAEKGFATLCSPVSEWLHYCNFLVDQHLEIPRVSAIERLKIKLKKLYMRRTENIIKGIFIRSGILSLQPIRIHRLIQTAKPYLSANLTGETILTVGSSLHEAGSQACGVIAIGPFGCMPNRLSETILTRAMTRESMMTAGLTDGRLSKILQDVEFLPFLAIESDGSPFPQLIQSKLEAFCLQARRLHQRMISI
jgi:predicted CoA-substrate-specific enzyme activase